ncbi:hypothetical protein PBI_121Q_279 [Escherichia phage 121Q]|uniref:Uncharacterized protein n=1 Tax=Escherichia phage 121Q TaxID=1555202 RepID=A0A097EXJ4_9CAUD|nr:hypothetical protein PBI_121Q_279 [Escherichia phage 121Q]AIT14169.1 hypothetical protein PBI_121Q_279 [Escherichia phage 121Q]MDI0804762.1 hypothetical protein [Escherichia coli]MED6971116.1 hypothetical protein [Escherichia coli O157]
MAIIITYVSGTTGTSSTVAVLTNKKGAELHSAMNTWAVNEFGQWASVEYIETYQVPSISLTDLGVDRILCLDELN